MEYGIYFLTAVASLCLLLLLASHFFSLSGNKVISSASFVGSCYMIQSVCVSLWRNLWIGFNETFLAVSHYIALKVTARTSVARQQCLGMIAELISFKFLKEYWQWCVVLFLYVLLLLRATVGQSSLISLTHHFHDCHTGSHFGWPCNQLISKVDGGITGRLRWLFPT